jgi:hypothetical protein
MTKTLIAAGLAACALAAPAAADSGPGYTALYPEVVPGAGLAGVAGASHTILRQAAGHGLVGSAAFTLSPSRVSYTAGMLHFRSLGVRTVLFGENAVKLRGTGLLNGRRVAFTAVGVHNALPGVDVFRIGWNHGATHGGVVTSGLVFIR